ncbi:MarR family winged helix-turn-helix transcriptional regulator [Gordonia hankookensis]|uniref:MarR family transcriptional regulator n=1 Tax=Gordonia hankookensis TaxID=589403 RepID=A0ABR7WEX2_9ACTN|nr:MarR family transcriptional regulator [Gordonia hankookensis]MBD1321338.1 MarR family transcriptional regulator [Gordonia hankookensis]NDZ97070.1 MarR family transcriptional regulator [Streptomyces sp. SID11726]NEB22809.1 MarR family transcriptional regulator [Streptomyces sp. SID6673]
MNSPGGGHAPDAPDLVDRIQREWAQAYPALDVRPVGVLGRIHHIAAVSSHRLDRHLEPHGVTRSEYDVLGALARSDRPLRASEVVSTTMLSGASITKITESLSRRGLLERRKSERDGRVVLLELTAQGRALVDDELPRRLADDERALAGLTPAERESLAALLRKISAAVGS